MTKCCNTNSICAAIKDSKIKENKDKEVLNTKKNNWTQFLSNAILFELEEFVFLTVHSYNIHQNRIIN